MLPWIGLLIGLVLVSVLGALGTVKANHARRLQTRAPRSSDTIVVALDMPVALLRHLGVNALYGLGYLLVGIVIGFIVGMLTGREGLNNAVAFGTFVTVLLSFVGPNARTARGQAVELLDKVGIRNVYVYWGVIVFTVLFALLVLSFGFSAAPAWNGMAPSNLFGG
ncbi:hypothetical protein ACFQXA_30425 [Nocardiopsis composta]